MRRWGVRGRLLFRKTCDFRAIKDSIILNKPYTMYSKPMFLLSLISVILFGCKSSQQSWLYSADSSATIYEDPGLTKEVIIVPAGHYVFVENNNPWGLVSYGETRGYTDLQAFKTKKKIGKKDLRRLQFSSDSMYVFSKQRSSSRKNRSFRSRVATSKQNVSFKRKSGGRRKPVAVKGYTRKNGTHVRPHTRSSPRRR